jgi:glycosyltransferase involved in cell wall biosynthesis
MRILVISNLYPPTAYGGYEALCAATVEHLRPDHDVLVLTSRDPKAPPQEGILRELPYLPKGKLNALKAPAAAPRAAGLMRRLLASFEPELVFIWNGSSIPQVVLRIAELSGLPLAWSIHEHWFSRLYTMDYFTRHLLPGDSGLRAAWGLVAKAVNRLPELRLEFERTAPAGVSWVSEDLRRRTPPPRTVEAVVERIIPSAVTDPELWLGLERRPDVDPPLIVDVGRVEGQKGPDVAYRALAALRDRHGIEARLVLAGREQPGMRAELDRLAAELGIGRQVELLGPLPPERIGELFERASVLMMPVRWQEPAGLVPIEAALARVPVVASRSGGMPERLLEGEHAVYFAIGDAEGCADALAATLLEESATAERVAQAYTRAHDFTFDGYVEQTLEFLTATLAGYSWGTSGSPVWASPE